MDRMHRIAEYEAGAHDAHSEMIDVASDSQKLHAAGLPDQILYILCIMVMKMHG